MCTSTGISWKAYLNKGDTTKTISKLVEACKQCSDLFRVGTANDDNPAFRQFAKETVEKLDQFGFELQTEIRRLGSEKLIPPHSESIPQDSEILALRSEISLQLALDMYEQALNTTIPSHARAMIKRQYFEIQQACEQLVSLRRVA
jgi:hypothetical protein